MTNVFTSSLVLLFVVIASTAVAQKKVLTIVLKENIKVSQSEAYDLLRNFERFPEWSPYLVTDPAQKYHTTGKIGEVGSSFHWEGVAEKSQGKQTLVIANGSDHLRMECDMVKPFKGQPVFEYQINETDHGVEITQKFEYRCSRFSYFMMKLFGVKKDIEKVNQLGLARLKTLLENGADIASSK